jgi:hypothetical protein
VAGLSPVAGRTMSAVMSSFAPNDKIVATKISARKGHPTSENGMDRPCSRRQRLSESDGASKDTRSTSNVPDDKRCSRQHHWHRYRQEHIAFDFGLDEQGMIVLREKLARGRIGGRAFLHLSYSYAAPCGPALLRDTRPTCDQRCEFAAGFFQV